MPLRVNFLQTPNQTHFVGTGPEPEWVQTGQDDFEAGLVRLSVKGLCNYLLDPQTCTVPGPAQQYCIRLPIAKLFNSQFFNGSRQDIILYGSSLRVGGICSTGGIQSAAKPEVKADVKSADAKDVKVKAACGSCGKNNNNGGAVMCCAPPICCADDQVIRARSVRVSGVQPCCDGEYIVYKFLSSDEVLASWALYGVPIHSVLIDGLYADQIKKRRRAPFENVAGNNQNIDVYQPGSDSFAIGGVGPGFCEATDYKLKRHCKKKSKKCGKKCH